MRMTTCMKSTVQEEFGMFRKLSTILLVLACMFLHSVVATAASSALRSIDKDDPYEPAQAPPIWGDITMDRNVDLNDLVALARNWNNAPSMYGYDASTILNEISRRWLQTVPLPLADLQWANRISMGSVESFPFAKNALEDYKSEGYYQAIGFGITYPESRQLNPVSGKRVFNIPNCGGQPCLTPVRFSQLPEGYDDSEDATRRFDFPLQEETYYFDYISSFAQELDVKGFDLNVEAKYSVYSGSVRSRARSNYYKSTRNHKVIFRATKSYGWFYLNDDLIKENLTEDFKDALASINSRDVINAFGTHYIYAEHLQSDLIIEVDFSTTTEKQRDQFGLIVKAAMDTPGTSFAMGAGITSLQASSEEIEIGRVTLTRRGGPNVITYIDPVTGENATFTGSLVLDISNLERTRQRIGAISDAWSAAVNPLNAVATDFISRPITDFYDSQVLPWTKEANMRIWFERYLRFTEQLEILEGTDNFAGVFDLDLDPPQLTRRFRHYRQAGDQNNNPAPGNFNDWEEYLWSRWEITAERYPLLLAAGRQLFEAKETDDILAIFNPRDSNFRLPLVELPRFLIEITDRTHGFSSPEACVYHHYGATLWVRGANFTLDDGYEWRVVYNTGLRTFPCFGEREQWAPTRPTSVFSGSDTYVSWLYFPSVDHPCPHVIGGGPVNCGSSHFQNWMNSDFPGIIFGVFDLISGEIVAYRCLGRCGDVSPYHL